MLVDFHMHSIFSDGVETPKDLLQHAIDCNVSMMALTDHDEIDGIQALRAAQKKLDPNESIKIVNGCEFSADYKDKSIHILGYCFDENNKVNDIKIINGDGFILCGVSYWSKNDGALIKSRIEEALKTTNFKNLYWDDIVKSNIKDLDVRIEKINSNDIYEIDNIEELKLVKSIVESK